MAPEEAYRTFTAADAKGFKAALIGGTLTFLAIYLGCGWGFHLWLGPRFRPELPGVFRIMLLGTYAAMWGLQPWYSLLGFGKSRHVTGAAIAMALGNVLFVVAWPWAAHSLPTLTTVSIGTSVGMLAATFYLRYQNARLTRDLAAHSGSATETTAFRKDLATT
jgi:hypothetical protein